jgi:hypothetical protein
MRTLKISAFFISFIIITNFACQRDVKDLTKSTDDIKLSSKQPVPPAVCNSNAYLVTLESRSQIGSNWEWIWSVKNPNPGNGTNGTSQDMSHWGMQFGTCLEWADIIGAAYSADGTTWTAFTPSYQVDPSQSCVTTPVLKFNLGTSGSAKSYYKLIISKNYSVDPAAFAYYKSQTVWCNNVTFGSSSYTQAQGNNIWNNAPNNSVAKKAFTQAAALQLSMLCVNNGAPIPADILAAYNTCVSFLSGLTYNDILTITYTGSSYPSVNAAQGAIGDWISINEATCSGGPIYTRNAQ